MAVQAPRTWLRLRTSWRRTSTSRRTSWRRTSWKCRGHYEEHRGCKRRPLLAREHRGKGLPVSAAVRAHPRANTRGESPRAREGAGLRGRPGPRTSSSSSSSSSPSGARCLALPEEATVCVDGQDLGGTVPSPPRERRSTSTARASDFFISILFTVLSTAAPFLGHVLVTASVVGLRSGEYRKDGQGPGLHLLHPLHRVAHGGSFSWTSSGNRKRRRLRSGEYIKEATAAGTRRTWAFADLRSRGRFTRSTQLDCQSLKCPAGFPRRAVGAAG